MFSPGKPAALQVRQNIMASIRASLSEEGRRLALGVPPGRATTATVGTSSRMCDKLQRILRKLQVNDRLRSGFASPRAAATPRINSSALGSDEWPSGILDCRQNPMVPVFMASFF